MVKQRFYMNGKLSRTSKPVTADRAQRWIDNAERDWTKNGLFPLTEPGSFDPNNAHEVTRVSANELIVVTTNGSILRFINVETA